MGTVGQFSVIFLPVFAHNSNEIYCRCSITQNIVKKRQPLFLAPPFLPSLNHFVKHAAPRRSAAFPTYRRVTTFALFTILSCR